MTIVLKRRIVVSMVLTFMKNILVIIVTIATAYTCE